MRVLAELKRQQHNQQQSVAGVGQRHLQQQEICWSDGPADQQQQQQQ